MEVTAALTIADIVILSPRMLWIASMVVAAATAVNLAHVSGLRISTMTLASLFGVLGAFWGGHIMSILIGQPWSLVDKPLLMFDFVAGEAGKAVIGACLGVAVFAAIVVKLRGESFFQYADNAVPAIALGYAFARIGCFLNGDDFGTVTKIPWSVRFPPGTEAFASHVVDGLISVKATVSMPVHPTQLYHALVGLVIFVTLTFWRPARTGGRVAIALITYGAIRFVLQFLRGDAFPIVGPLDLNQLLCVGFILAGAYIWWLNPNSLLNADPIQKARASGMHINN